MKLSMMRQRFPAATAFAAFTGGVLLLAQAPRPAAVQFKAAQHKEEVEGDLKGAVEQYKKIAQGGDRTQAAKALVAVGKCYEKLGQQEARLAYERVLRDFADQPASVEYARMRLAALSAPAALGGQTARQVWMPRASDDPSESIPAPDGRFIGFTDCETGDLGVRDLTSGVGRRLTNTGGWGTSGDFAEGSIISPDSRQIAYTWFSEKELQWEVRITPLGGGTPRILYRSDQRGEYMRPSGWTPDGRQLLVTRNLADGTSQLALISLHDGSLRTLKSFTVQNGKASMSPDGQYIAYDLPAPGKTPSKDIFLLGLDSGLETRAVEHPADDHSPLWSPDGSRILFLSDRTGTPSLWSLAIDGGKPKGPPVLIKTDVGPIRLLGMTRNGTLYYDLPTSNRRNIYTAGIDAGGRVSQAPALAIERFINSNVGASISPDGEYLAYYSLRPGTSGTVVVHTLKTGEERNFPLGLAVASSFAMGPKWFPDGRSLLVLLREPERAGGGFYRLDLSSGKAEVLHHALPNGFQGYSLSPDGKSFFYTQRNPATSVANRLLRFDIERHQETEIKNDTWVISPTVSPDGKQLAFVVSVRPGSESYIAVIPASGGQAREVVRVSPWMDGSRYNSLAWTSDQRYLLFARGGTGDNLPNVLWRVPLSGDPPEQMGLSMMGRIKSPQVHPDGRRLFFTLLENGPDEVWALENFLPKTVAAK